MVSTVILKPGREKSVLIRHPWIFSGAVDSLIGVPLNGEPVVVCDSRGRKLGWGGISSQSSIRIRMWTFDEDQQVDRRLLEERLGISIRRREGLYATTNSIRLVFAESDGLPGLIVDQYNEILVVQFLAAASEYFRNEIIGFLDSMLHPKVIYERSDVEVRSLEGLSPRKGYLKGEGKPVVSEITEGKLRYMVDVANGQKTGFYLDQRRNRLLIPGYSEGKDCLNCFCYTGGFSMNLLMGNAKSVVSIDSSAEAINQARKNVALNNLQTAGQEWIEGDVFYQLRKFRDQGKDFDLIVLDPPKFAPTRSQVEKASKAYKDINLLAIKLLRDGGTLFTFSCSGGINLDLFQKIIAGAAHDSGKEVRIAGWLFQDMDHPVCLNFPESLYLKGLVCRV